MLPAVLAVIVAADSSTAQTDYWEECYGPYGGFVSCLGMNKHGDIVAGTVGGAYLTRDTGRTWTNITYDFNRHLKYWPNVQKIAITDSGVVFVGSYSSVYRFASGGYPWQTATAGIVPDQTIEGFAVAPDGSIWLGTDNSGGFGAVYRSVDGGFSWTASALDSLSMVFDIEVNAAGAVFVSARRDGSPDNIYRSFDLGNSWKQGWWSMTTRYVILARGPRDDLYFAGWVTPYPQGTAERSYVYRSTTNADSWLPISPGWSEPILSLAVSPSNRLYAGTLSGIACAAKPGDPWTFRGPAVGTEAVFAIECPGPEEVVAGLHNGVFRSKDGGSTWTETDNGLKATDVRSLLITPTGRLLAGTEYSGIYYSDNRGGNWERAEPRFMEGVRTMLNGRTGRLYALSFRDDVNMHPYGMGLMSSSDDGITWRQIVVPSGRTISAFNIGVSGDLLLATYSNTDGDSTVVMRSTDAGASWSSSAPAPDEVARVVLETRDSLLFLGTRRGIFRSSDGGMTWDTTALVRYEPECLFELPNGWLIAGTPSGSFRSTDGGRRWNTWGYLVRGGTVLDTSCYFFTMPIGLYYSRNGGKNWRFDGVHGPDHAAMRPLAVYPDGQVFAGTEGHGVLRSVQSLSTGIPGMPFLRYPPDGAQGISPRDSVKWLYHMGLAYAVQVARDSLFSDLTMDHAGLLQCCDSLVNLSPETRYYWRVRASNDSSTGPWSYTWSFTTAAPVPPPPSDFFLGQNYPNPASNTASIRYEIPTSVRAAVQLYDLLGREIRVLSPSRFIQGGVYSVVADVRDLPDGLYFYRLLTPLQILTRSMHVLHR